MKYWLIIILLWSNLSLSAEVPTSARSLNVNNRIQAELIQELKLKGLELGSAIFIRIFKQSGKLELWMENDSKTFTMFKSYEICTFSGALGPKLTTGDLQSPEGFYFVNSQRLNPWSKFHLSFNLGYPNSYDRYHGRTGSALMVHGNCASIGCYAMTDPFIDEIYTIASAALEKGQPFFRVHAFPFEMTIENMESHKSSKWYPFWINLKKGYELFELNKRPPNVEVNNGKYIFSH